MRKLFFVKKNVNEPTGASNWIEMNVDEFNKFISTEEGKDFLPSLFPPRVFPLRKSGRRKPLALSTFKQVLTSS